MFVEYLSRRYVVDLSSPVKDGESLGLQRLQRGNVSLEHPFAVVSCDFRMNTSLMPGPEEVRGFKQQSFAIPFFRDAFQH